MVGASELNKSPATADLSFGPPSALCQSHIWTICSLWRAMKANQIPALPLCIYFRDPKLLNSPIIACPAYLII